MIPKQTYLLTTSALGLVLFGLSVAMLFATGIDSVGVVLIGLTVLTGWLRVDLDPSEYISLTPFTIFVALLLSGPSVALFAATFAVAIAARFFARSSLLEACAEMGEQGVATLAAAAVAIWMDLSMDALPTERELFVLFLAMMTFSAIRLLLATVGSNFAEGIGILSFIRGAGKYMTIHLVGLSVAVLGLIYLLDRIGYLTLPLATVALIGFYYPAKLIGEQRSTLFASLAMIAGAIELKDTYTATHSHNVETIAIRTARAMGLPEAEVRRIRFGALLHDIGKVGVSGEIIRKPTSLDPSEQAKMRQHPVIGAEIMQPVELLSEAAEIVRHHHEHYDGSGYPDGLKGEGIPIGSRIILVADAYHAITSDRPYRRGRSKDEALRILKENAGKQFDPKVVETFESVVGSV